MTDTPQTATSKAGTYDVVVGTDGFEVPVYIVEDSLTRMVVQVVATGQVLHLAKHVQ